MEEGFRNWNNDDSRTEGLDRRMNTIDYQKKDGKNKARRDRLNYMVKQKDNKNLWKAITKILKKNVGFVVELGTWVSYFGKLFANDKTGKPSDRTRNSAAPVLGSITLRFSSRISQRNEINRPKKNEELKSRMEK